MAYTKYSLTPANNNAAPPNGAPEGMLPSAVNDTMRDMMSQIRDVGDGIRGGTYTMTAPVITGGSITGVALSGNTLTSPVITGGSINNTPIGASTANTGAFTTLSASSTATLNTLVSSGATITGGTISGVSLSATSPNFTTPVLGTPSSGTLTNCTGLPVATGVSGLGANVATFLGTPSSANLAAAVTNETGTGSLVFATNPVLVTPNLGTPSAATLTNATGLPVGTGISGLGTGVATFLATPSSANLRTAVTDETGSGALVFATSPTLVTPVLGVATATSVQGIIGNVTPAAGTFTSLTANGNTTLGDAAGDTTTVPDLKALQVTSADRHSVRPSLLLDFANTKTLDPRITFTRASTGTFYDGKTVAKAEENLLTYSQDIDNAAWAKLNSSVTANATAAPDGTTTAEKLNVNTTTGQHAINSSFGFAANLTLTRSCFVKAGELNFVCLTDNTANAVFFNLSTGVQGTVIGTCTNITITSFGNGWYRCSYTSTHSGSTTYGILASNADNVLSFAGANTTDGIFVWGAQVEQRSSVTAYTATTTAAITNYIPVLQSAAAGVARFEHNPVTGESLGLEIEEQRTNLLTYSELFNTSSFWNYTNVSVVTTANIAPSGLQTAQKIVETATNTVQRIGNFSTTLTSGASYTLSIYAKAAERNWIRLNGDNMPGSVWFNLSNGTTGTVNASTTVTGYSITSAGNGWYRCSVTFTIPNTTPYFQYTIGNADNVGTYTGNGFSGIYIWGAQLEAGTFATSYIPTVASQVTRSADAASMTGTNFSSWYRTDEGSFYTEAATNATGDAKAVSVTDGTASGQNNAFTLDSNGTKTRFIVNVGGNVQASYVSTANYTRGSFVKLAGAYAVNNLGGTTNAEAITTDTSGLVPVVNSLEIGFHRIGSPLQWLNGTIKKLTYYPKRLTNAELQGLTTV